VSSPPHLWTETDPVSETSCFLFSRIPDDWKNPNPVILCAIHHRQNPLESFSVKFMPVKIWSERRLPSHQVKPPTTADLLTPFSRRGGANYCRPTVPLLSEGWCQLLPTYCLSPLGGVVFFNCPLSYWRVISQEIHVMYFLICINFQGSVCPLASGFDVSVTTVGAAVANSHSINTLFKSPSLV
jgi:hypothetical protein